MKKWLLLLFLVLPLKAEALTLSDIRDQIRILIKDTDSSRRRYSDAQLLDFINEAQRDASSNSWIVQKSTSITLTTDTTYYSLPSDTIEITRVTRDYDLLEETTFDKEDSDADGSSWETEGGVPLEYFQDSTQPDKIGIRPWSSGTSSTGTARIHYIAQPVDLSSDSDVPFNSHNRYLPYHDILIYYVVTRIFMLEGETNKVTLYAQLYESRLQMMREKVGQKVNYSPGFSGQRTGSNQ